jgi:biopolymer transport protein TolR
MGMSASGAGGGGGRHRRRRAPVMAEINVTPMVDVMLVLLIIFMVAAPLLTTNIQVDLPSAQGGTLSNAESLPLVLSVKKTGGNCASKTDIYLGDTTINLADLGPKMKAIKDAKAGTAAADNNVVNIRGDRDICYTDMMKVLGLARDAGYRANMVIVPEQAP